MIIAAGLLQSTKGMATTQCEGLSGKVAIITLMIMDPSEAVTSILVNTPSMAIIYNNETAKTSATKGSLTSTTSHTIIEIIKARDLTSKNMAASIVDSRIRTKTAIVSQILTREIIKIRIM